MKHRIMALREELKRHSSFLESDELKMADPSATVSEDSVVETATLVIERMASVIKDMQSEIDGLIRESSEGPH